MGRSPPMAANLLLTIDITSSIMKKAFLYTLMFLLLQMSVTFLVILAWLLVTSPGHDGAAIGRQFAAISSDPVAMVVSAGVFNVVSSLLFVGLRWTPVSRSYAESRPLAAMLWCVVAALGSLLPSLWLQEQMPDLPDNLSETMMQMMHVPGCFFVIAVLAPLCEELVFRGAVLRALLRSPLFGGVQESLRAAEVSPSAAGGGRVLRLTGRQWGAVALSALCFALVHGNPAQMPHAFLMGLLLGWLFARTGSVLPGVVLHVANNTAAYLMAAAYPSTDIRLVDIMGGSEGRVLMALGFSLMLLLPALYQLHLNLHKADDR